MFLISHLPAIQGGTSTVGGGDRDKERDPLDSPSAVGGEVKPHMLEVIITLETGHV